MTSNLQLQNDPRIQAPAIAIRGLHGDRWLKVCGGLATASKHFKLTQRIPVVASTASSRGYNVGRYGKGGYRVGEASINVELNDGTKFGCLDLVRGVLSTWSIFFAIHSI
jgi:hypothetical protein